MLQRVTHQPFLPKTQLGDIMIIDIVTLINTLYTGTINFNVSVIKRTCFVTLSLFLGHRLRLVVG